jgi:hypothetical protein
MSPSISICITGSTSTTVDGQNLAPPNLSHMWGTRTYTPPAIWPLQGVVVYQFLVYTCFLRLICKEHDKVRRTPRALRALFVVVFVFRAGNRYTPTMGIHQQIRGLGGANPWWLCISAGPPCVF